MTDEPATAALNPAAAVPENWMAGFASAPGAAYTYRAFRREDMLALENVAAGANAIPIIGGTMEKDGAPVAYAGVNQILDKHWAFFFIQDPSLRRTLWLMRLMRRCLAQIRDSGIAELYVLCDTRVPRARDFVTALGFVELDSYEKTLDVRVYEKLMGGYNAWRLTLGPPKGATP